jgi:hypothetical protein
MCEWLQHEPGSKDESEIEHACFQNLHDLGVSLGIQEIPTFEMCIAIRFTSPQLPGINGGAD